MSQESREITIFFSQTSVKEVVNTTAKTWGELRSQLRDGNAVKEKTCVTSGDKHILALDDAILPSGKFTVFVFPKESKGGMAKKPVKKAKPTKKAAKPAKKVVKKAIKKVVKKAAAKTPAPNVADVVSSVENDKIARQVDLDAEARAIAKGLKGFR